MGSRHCARYCLFLGRSDTNYQEHVFGWFRGNILPRLVFNVLDDRLLPSVCPQRTAHERNSSSRSAQVHVM